MNVDCPVCKRPLTRDLYEGVAIFRCGDCHGIFAEERRIQQIRASREQPTSALEREAVSDASPDTENRLRCPKCRARIMVKEDVPLDSGDDASFMIDVCHDCDGVWFDGGELARLQLNFEQSAQAVEAWRLKKLSEQRTPEEEKQLERQIAAARRTSNLPFSLPIWAVVLGAGLAILVFSLLLYYFNKIVT